MSFTSEVKREITSDRQLWNRFKNPQSFGLLVFARRFSADAVEIATREESIALHYQKAIRAAIPLRGELVTQEEAAPDGGTIYHVRLTAVEDRRELYNHFAMLYPEGITYDLLGGDEGTAAFVGGAFLACGSLTDPNKNYHLEFAPPREELCGMLTEMLTEVGFFPKVSNRRGLPMVYFRDSEQMEDLLTFLGCPRMSMEIMAVKILKERRNAANRAFNCDNANIDKVVGAARAQIEDIRLIQARLGEESLPEELRDIARLRLENPGYSLRELGEELGLSRSGVNHRLKKIGQYAAQLREDG